MDQQTRHFLTLLGAELTDAILGQIGSKSRTASEIAAQLGRDSRDVTAQLALLAHSDLARSARAPAKGPGRPKITWRATNSELVGEFEAHVRELRHRLIDSDGDGSAGSRDSD